MSETEQLYALADRCEAEAEKWPGHPLQTLLISMAELCKGLAYRLAILTGAVM
jgi:hypothetical protein